MDETFAIQGRYLKPVDITRIRGLIAENLDWRRRQLSEVFLAEWNWHNLGGRSKDTAGRSLLAKLDARGLIELPARRQVAFGRMATRQVQPKLRDQTPVA
jgi:hypothetical protein